MQLPDTITEETIANISKYMLSQKQEELPIIHRFGPGIYMREMSAKAGLFIMGHVHKQEHINIMLKGKCILYKGDGSKIECIAPMYLIAPPGRKIAYVIEDMIWINIYSTNETDVEKLEETYLDKEASPWAKDTLLLEDMSFIKESQDDFLDVCTLLGFTQEQVRHISEFEEDLIPFPQGSYSCIISDSLIEGKGLFATASIMEGQKVAPARVEGKRTPAGRYTNHGVLPNAKMVMKNNGDVDLIAIQDIKGSFGGQLGEEILVDYYDSFLNTRENIG